MNPAVRHQIDKVIGPAWQNQPQTVLSDDVDVLQVRVSDGLRSFVAAVARGGTGLAKLDRWHSLMLSDTDSRYLPKPVDRVDQILIREHVATDQSGPWLNVERGGGRAKALVAMLGAFSQMTPHFALKPDVTGNDLRLALTRLPRESMFFSQRTRGPVLTDLDALVVVPAQLAKNMHLPMRKVLGDASVWEMDTHGTAEDRQAVLDVLEGRTDAEVWDAASQWAAGKPVEPATMSRADSFRLGW